MVNIEQAEKLREKANVTYEEAKTALEAANGDILEAMIYLERQGKAEPPKNGGYYNSKSQGEEEKENKSDCCKGENYNYHHGQTFFQLAGKFLKWCGKMISKGNQNIFEVKRHDNVVISIPVTVLAILLFFAFWITIPLIIIGLFFGYRYIFKGPDLGKPVVNKFMDSAAGMAENIKKEVNEGNKEN